MKNLIEVIKEEVIVWVTTANSIIQKGIEIVHQGWHEIVIRRLFPISSFYFMFVELCYYFGDRIVYTEITSIYIKLWYLHNIVPLSNFFRSNIYVIFIVMLVIFQFCAQGSTITLPNGSIFKLPKFTRFNIIQAIILEIWVSCFGQIYYLTPVAFRECNLGYFVCFSQFLVMMYAILYCIWNILWGEYPYIPVISEGAKIQTYRGFMDKY